MRMARMAKMSSMARMASASPSIPALDEDSKRQKAAERAADYYQRNKQTVKDKVVSYRKTNPHKRAAHNVVTSALSSGKLVRPPTCSGDLYSESRVCTREHPDAHHDDYTRPLHIIWLCRSCHRLRHRNLARFDIDPDTLWEMEQRAIMDVAANQAANQAVVPPNPNSLSSPIGEDNNAQSVN